MDVDPTADILRNIIQNGSLDYDYTSKRLIQSSDAKKCYFFEVTDANFLICKFSNNQEFIIGTEYDPDDLPLDPIPWYIFEKSVAIAVIYLDTDFIESLDKEPKQRAHDSICVGIIINHIRSSNFHYNESVCTRLLTLLKGIYHEIKNNKDESLKHTITELVNESVSVISDLQKYSSIITNLTVLDKSTVNMESFIQVISDIVNDQMEVGRLTFVTENSVDETLVFDKKLVMDILLTSLVKLVKVGGNLNLRTSSKPSYKESDSVFLEFLVDCSIRGNITRIFQKETISVESVGLHIISKLITLFNGDIQIINDQLRIRIEVDHSHEVSTILKYKRVLLSVSGQLGSIIYGLLSENKAIVSISGNMDQLALYQKNQDNFDLIILDNSLLINYFGSSLNKVLLLTNSPSSVPHSLLLSSSPNEILDEIKKIVDPNSNLHQHFSVLCISKTRVFYGNLTIFMSTLDTDIKFSNVPIVGDYDIVFVDATTIMSLRQFGKLVVIVDSMERPIDTSTLTNFMTVKDFHSGNLHDILKRI